MLEELEVMSDDELKRKTTLTYRIALATADVGSVHGTP